MDMCVGVSTKETAAGTTTKELKGSVLDVLQKLLAGGNYEEVIKLVEKLVARNLELELMLAKMRGSKNRRERVSTEQLVAVLEKLDAESEGALVQELQRANRSLESIAKANAGRPEVPKPPKQPAVRRPPPPGLRRVENPLPVPEQDRPCPECRADRECIGHETTEVIDLIPAEVIVRLDIREVLGCKKCDAELIRAPLGDKVVAGGAYGSRLVADLVVGKYWTGLPLNRQGEELLRLGLSMPSSSMADQMTWATDLLRPLWHQLLRQVLSAEVLQVDATSLPVKDRDSAKGIVNGALWGYVGDTDKAVYLYTSTGKKLGQREGEIGPEQFLSLRKGPIVADGANLFDTLFQSPERIEVGCNMHARRGFKKALEAGDLRAAVPLAAFKTLYDVEETARDWDPQARVKERYRRSTPVYDELIEWCRTYQTLEPPSSLLGKAIQYVLNQREALTRFLEDGRLPIDNGIVERLHRRPAVGRRNYLFAGSQAAGERAAIAYSLLATCALNNVNMTEYLADILPKLVRGSFTEAAFATLLPAAWKAAQANAPAP